MSISLQPYGLSPQVSAILGILQEGIQEWLPCPPPGGLPEPGILNILDNLTWAWVGEGIKEWRDSHGFALRFSLLQGPYWWMQFLETWSHLLPLPVTSPPEVELIAWTEDLSVWAELGAELSDSPNCQGPRDHSSRRLRCREVW